MKISELKCGYLVLTVICNTPELHLCHCGLCICYIMEGHTGTGLEMTIVRSIVPSTGAALALGEFCTVKDRIQPTKTSRCMWQVTFLDMFSLSLAWYCIVMTTVRVVCFCGDDWCWAQIRDSEFSKWQQFWWEINSRKRRWIVRVKLKK